uniref:SPOR domain-containing protein n=1 Tax=Magnetococcus massalia (strain MO-1) TaxID=451514 RepID=A0A1S7LGH5_MAGMO|nr:exported protein of unknown function[include trypsin domain] [Candidatus Magnetococcus massalia]
MRSFFILLTLPLLLAVAGCQTVQVKHVEEKAPIPISVSNEEARHVMFRKIKMKLKRGKIIGSYGSGLLCIPKGKVTWRGGRVNVTTEDLMEIFNEELERANYPTAGDPNALFEDESIHKAELHVGGHVTDLRIKLCYPLGGFGNFDTVTGEASIKVNWQVYSRFEKRVLLNFSTEGSHKLTDSSPEGAALLTDHAFAVAVNNMLANRSFYNVVKGREQKSPAEQKSTTAQQRQPVSIEAIPPSRSTIQAKMDSVRAAVVTIRTGAGHGSGFFISKDGLALTNAHVVGDARFVKLTLVSGRSILGEVLRKDRARDIALIKAEEGNMTPLPLQLVEPPIGTDTYAVGAPLDEKLSSTVVKGIVSAYRYKKFYKQRFLQSDAMIHGGNSGGPLLNARGEVVAISVLGRISQSGDSTNLNFFIPIKSGLDALNIVQSGHNKPALVAGNTPPVKTRATISKKSVKKDAPAPIQQRKPTLGKEHWLYLGSYSKAESVIAIAGKLAAMGSESMQLAKKVKGRIYTRLYAGPFSTQDEAMRVQKLMRTQGYRGSLTTERPR